jgi:hypothetical protein
VDGDIVGDHRHAQHNSSISDHGLSDSGSADRDTDNLDFTIFYHH